MELDIDGRFLLPAGTRRIWIEVGCNMRNTLAPEVARPENADVLLVQFEPLLEKYAALLSAAAKVGHNSAESSSHCYL